MGEGGIDGIESGIIVCNRENDVDFKKIMEIGPLNLNFKVTVSRGNAISIDFGSTAISGEDQIMAVYYANLHDSYGRAIPFPLLLFWDKVYKT